VDSPNNATTPALRDLERRFERLSALAEARHEEFRRLEGELHATRGFLALAPLAAERLEALSRDLFGEILDEIEAGMTQAIREILGQERRVASVRDVQRGRLAVAFHIEQDGCEEDILAGQGGSVANILSVSLRLLALSQLDPGHHRPFLVLDEQDCWLKPQLVPRFMGVIRAVAEKLGLQVLVISHHPLDLFAAEARRIFELTPSAAGAVVRALKEEPGERCAREG